MKSVLISIRPQWCEKICNQIGTDQIGKPLYEKSVDVRKTRPKLDTPFKVYIYCTRGEPTFYVSNALMVPYRYTDDHSHNMGDEPLNSKVIGEFVCDSIRCFDVPYPAFQDKLDKSILEQSCCTYYMLHRYAYHDALYGWHISDLKIYDKPRELGEFCKPCTTPKEPYCPCCKFGLEIYHDDVETYADTQGSDFEQICTNHLKRPPMSWCYVEEEL